MEGRAASTQVLIRDYRRKPIHGRSASRTVQGCARAIGSDLRRGRHLGADRVTARACSRARGNQDRACASRRLVPARSLSERAPGPRGRRHCGRRWRSLRRQPRAGGAAGDAALLHEQIAAFRTEIAERWPVEDKGLSLSLHYREAPDEARAVSVLETIADDARAAGLVVRWGRKGLEIRPLSEHDKGSAVRTLIVESGSSTRPLRGRRHDRP